ncbi:uncharacterized protein LOC123228044 [Mangifera indica]|uniref:uncharacterized protein LOC123228044 n=1 Tax=Mangifera indica TaxID=29780 RepID=UPI001CFAD6E1|nr:uncharacterized protein LOC123228044 [Mangifera indica]
MTGVTLGACRNIHHRCLRPSIVGVGVVKRLQVSNLQRLALNLENPNLCHGSIVLSSSKIKAAHNDISKLLYIKVSWCIRRRMYQVVYILHKKLKAPSASAWNVKINERDQEFADNSSSNLPVVLSKRKKCYFHYF